MDDQSAFSPLRARWALVALAVVCLLWAGMVLGISVLEAPVKFQAPSLTRAVGLDVGRVVFGVFNKVEIGWSLITFILLWLVRPFARTPRVVGVLFALIWLIVTFQSLVLIPALAHRAQLVMNNQPLPPAPYHALYSSTELIKLISLIVLGVLLTTSYRQPATDNYFAS